MNITLPGAAATFQASQRAQAERERARLGVEARSWYRISNAASDTEAEVMLYDEVGGWLGATADEFIADLRGITAPNLRVRVNSPGGSVFEGIAIANALRSHPANVTVQVDGIAASIASVIAMAGDRVVMQPQSMLMVHDASGVCMGNAADMTEMGALLDKISDNIADAYGAKAGGTRDEWRQTMRAETWYTADEAVEAGLADEVVAARKEPQPDGDEPDMHRAYDLADYGYTGPRTTEQPKAEAEPTTVTLTFNVGDTIDEQLLDTLRNAVAQRGEPAVPSAEDTATVEPVAEATPVEPAPAPAEPEPEAPAAEPVDEWAAAVAALIPDDADDWSALVSNLTGTTASSSAATEA